MGVVRTVNKKTRSRGVSIIDIILTLDTGETPDHIEISKPEIKERYRERDYFEQVSDQQLNSDINALKDTGILIKVPAPEKKEKQGPDPDFYIIKRDIKTLLKIAEFYYLTIKKLGYNISENSPIFYRSFYFIDLLNDDLINQLEKEFKITLEPHEREIVIKAFNIFPNSFWNIIEYLYHVKRLKKDYKRYNELIIPQELENIAYEEDNQVIEIYELNELKSNFLNKIQLGIGEHLQHTKDLEIILKHEPKDIKSKYFKPLEFNGEEYKVNYEVKVSIRPKGKSNRKRDKTIINKSGEIVTLKTSYSKDLT